MSAAQDPVRGAVESLRRGSPVALATVVRVRGSTPQKPGAKLLVRSDGTTAGTLGGGCVEGDVWEIAKQALREGKGPQLRSYALNEPYTSPHGMVCGGTIEFLVEPVRRPEEFLPYAEEAVRALDGAGPIALALVTKPESALGRKLLVRSDGTTLGTLGDPGGDAEAAGRAPGWIAEGGARCVALGADLECFVEVYGRPPTLVMVGGGHIGRALEPLAKTLGFRFCVIDDRPRYANRDRFVEADEVLVADFAEGLRSLDLTPDTCIVVATRGHRYDDVALEAAARSPAGYVGLVGSRRKVALIFDQLLKRGVSPERVGALRAPIGLDIGARTPEEIALSIISEILMLRRGGTGRPMKADGPAPSR